MKVSTEINEQVEYLKKFINFIPTGAESPEEILDTLTKFEIDWVVTEEGTLMIKYWQVTAEGFVSAEQAAVIRSTQPFSEQRDLLDWLSKNLPDIRKQYGGQWVAIHSNQIVASALNLADLLTKAAGFDTPLITFIPAEPVVWTFTYAT